MGNFLDILYDVLFHPAVAMRTIASEKRLGYSLGVFLLSVFVPAWASYFGLQSVDFSVVAWFVIIGQILISLVFWIVGAGFFGLIAELLGGHGTAAGLLAAMGFSHFPRIFIAPLLVFASLLPRTVQALFLALFVSVTVVWTLILYIIAIREAYLLSTLRAVMVLITPLAVIFGIGIVIVVSVGTMLLQWLPWL
ncbi:MAG: Yip1 protein [Firmicutes bacterium]|nr:Yip1 protein [Bacillota bacterium]